MPNPVSTPLADPVLELHELSAGYGERAVVREVNLTVSSGEIVALLGPNGAGKSTTLLTVAGELPAIGGEVRWFGEAMKTPLHKRARAGLAFVPEERSILKSLSVKDNLLLGSGGTELAVALFPELIPLMGRKAGLLSGGEQQMLTLGRAMASRPKALVLDEISLGLSPAAVDRLFAALRLAADEYNVAVLLVEQRARRALQVADRWYLLRRGTIAGSGEGGTGLDGLEASYLADATLEQNEL